MEVKVLLLDIEGTTTPIQFVHDVLFPFARERMHEFVTTNFDAIAADRAAIAAEERVDPDDVDAIVDAVHRQMDVDKKSTALKSLQGKVWKAGYADGTLQSEVFGDVPTVLKTASEAGIRVCIYSSGSVAAQKLLFRYTTRGDLTPWLSAYFDTTTGPKKENASYQAIAAALGVDPRAVLFGTDSHDEARAAREAGVRAVLLVRPGNPELPAHDFESWETLEPVLALLR